MLCILPFLSGCCSETEVSEQLYCYKARAAAFSSADSGWIMGQVLQIDLSLQAWQTFDGSTNDGMSRTRSSTVFVMGLPMAQARRRTAADEPGEN
jgi:hypothetical protein